MLATLPIPIPNVALDASLPQVVKEKAPIVLNALQRLRSKLNKLPQQYCRNVQQPISLSLMTPSMLTLKELLPPVFLPQDLSPLSVGATAFAVHLAQTLRAMDGFSAQHAVRAFPGEHRSFTAMERLLGLQLPTLRQDLLLLQSVCQCLLESQRTKLVSLNGELFQLL